MRAMDAGSSKDTCAAATAKDTDGDGVLDTFTSVSAPTAVCFEIVPQTNRVLPARPSAQFARAFVDVTTMPATTIERRTVLFVVPGK
jgi:hypothetical protein